MVVLILVVLICFHSKTKQKEYFLLSDIIAPKGVKNFLIVFAHSP
jgi:hypothetical protein